MNDCCSDLYKNTLKQYVENKYVVESTGFKALPETINGRAAMLGEAVYAGDMRGINMLAYCA